jgi:hypothetical protein
MWEFKLYGGWTVENKQCNDKIEANVRGILLLAKSLKTKPNKHFIMYDKGKYRIATLAY